ncbi:hypothetical protein POF51_26275 [Brevibacillus sp. AG]|uniref:hypothetical protein n=1 Tax=Brevibacillus sp. AG TaxID=3020891 RepID=UPI00232D9B5D|nr:hypothetical protein [Brevibacillus sp. AG]MDC0764230.1 hypothetical protein [Brevibacillus sp. AG]
MQIINELIDKHDWAMLSWRERYGDGIWVALAPAVSMLDNIEFISTGNDIQSIELALYLNGQGLWLPVVQGETIIDALRELDLKTSSVPEEFLDKWMRATYDAYERLYELGRRDGYKLKAAITAKDKTLLVPEELQEFMELMKAHCFPGISKEV